jgi:hypothetical protein
MADAAPADGVFMRPWSMLVRGRLALRDERGIALVMAIGIMLVLTIAVTTVIFFTSAGARHANISNAGQKAYAIAEAGLAGAISEIAPHYPNSSSAGDNSWVTGSLRTYPGGHVSWTGSFDPTTEIWSLTGTGTVKNPTGGADITRTVNAKIPVTLGPPPFTRYGLFVDDAIGDCPSLSGNNIITVPVYAKGCLELSGDFGIEEPNASGPTSVSVNVGGDLKDNSGSAHVGTIARPIDWLGAGNCNGGLCPGTGDFRARRYGRHMPVALPTVDMNAQYAKANWSAATCAAGTNPFDDDAARNTSLSATNLMGSSYDCTARDGSNNFVGRLGWNNAGTTSPNGIPSKTLLVEGMVFVDRSLSLGSNDGLQYAGNGTIYVNGKVDIAGTICGPGSSWNGTDCGKTWSPLSGLGALLIVVGNAGNADPAVNVGSQGVVEAGLWIVTGNVDSTGNPFFGGSVFVDNGTGRFRGGGGMQAFINLPAGAPSGQEYILGTASNFTGG